MNAPLPSSREARVLLLPGTRRDGDVIATFLGQYGIQCTICSSPAGVADALTESVGALLLSEQVVSGGSSHLICDALSNQPSWSDIPVLFFSAIGKESRAMSEMIGRMTNVTLLDRPISMRTLLSAVQGALRARAKQYQIRDQVMALQVAQLALRESDRRKDEFLAMLAHELRNPLAAIRTAGEILPRLVDAERSLAGSTIAIMRRQTLQLARLVDDLLDVSRITRGRIEIQHRPVNISAVVGQALETVDSIAKERRHTIHTDVTPDVYVEGDNARLIQSVSNLLTNAIKYTEPGGRICVTLVREEGHALLTVSDNGIGIPADLLPRVFDLFVQNRRALDRSEGGLGIGLSVVRQLIEMQGGTVSAASPGAGRGSSFRIRLPTIAAPIADAIPTPINSRTPLRVLVVDDNHDAADSLTTLLSFEGHTVQTAYDGEAALEAAAKFPADVILLDIGLPAMNGYEVAGRLRGSGTPSTLVALTGYGQKEDIERAVQAGFDAHLAKPVEFSRLEEIFDKARSKGMEVPATEI